MRQLFEQGHGFVASGLFEGNAASLRVQEKLGFRVVNERFIEARPHGRLMPHLDTVLGRGRWSGLRQAALTAPIAPCCHAPLRGPGGASAREACYL